jgi:hypothetical protein
VGKLKWGKCQLLEAVTPLSTIGFAIYEALEAVTPLLLAYSKPCSLVLCTRQGEIKAGGRGAIYGDDNRDWWSKFTAWWLKFYVRVFSWGIRTLLHYSKSKVTPKFKKVLYSYM